MILRSVSGVFALSLTAALVASTASSTNAFAGNVAADPTVLKEASTHFERGVQLYNEADYRASLVEFRRAYQLAPNAAVLYNIGETYFQLQNYASAATAFEQFMNEAPPDAQHRQEVQDTLKVLKTRVGRLDVQTNIPGATIAVDDEKIGTTPMTAPPRVSIGHRKVTATHEGSAPVTEYVDISGDETAHVTLTFVLPSNASGSGAAASADDGHVARNVRTGLWIGTGALAAGAIVTGILAINAGSTLSDDKNAFPTSRSTLDSDKSRTLTLSVLADSLGAAAIVAGGVALYLTLKPHHEAAASTPDVALRFTGNGGSLIGHF